MRGILRKAFGAAFAVGVSLTIMGALAAPASASPGYPCPGGTFCGFDERDGQGGIVAQVGSRCVLTDIGQIGDGDKVTSVWNRTGRTVDLLDWGGDRWVLVLSVPNDGRDNLPHWLSNRTDAIKVCA